MVPFELGSKILGNIPWLPVHQVALKLQGMESKDKTKLCCNHNNIKR